MLIMDLYILAGIMTGIAIILIASIFIGIHLLDKHKRKREKKQELSEIEKELDKLEMIQQKRVNLYFQIISLKESILRKRERQTQEEKRLRKSSSSGEIIYQENNEFNKIYTRLLLAIKDFVKIRYDFLKIKSKNEISEIINTIEQDNLRFEKTFNDLTNELFSILDIYFNIKKVRESLKQEKKINIYSNKSVLFTNSVVRIDNSKPLVSKAFSMEPS